MNKEHILERLKMLVELCSETEPDFPDNKILFTGQLITAKELYDRFDTGVSESENEIPEIMKQANKIWRIRNKIKNGEWDDVQHAETIDTIEDFLSEGQKINAIKHYREAMSTSFGEKVGLRDAKEYVDNLQIDMRRRGILKSSSRISAEILFFTKK